MKICFLAPANSLHSYRWIKFFVERGHDVYWLSFYELSVDGFCLHSFENFHYYEMNPPLTKPLTPFFPPVTSILRIFPAVRWIRRLLKEIKPDFMHVHSVGIYGLAAAMSGFHPLVATAWGSDVLVGGQLKVKRPFVKYILQRADLITCDAHHMVAAMVGLGADERKLRVINFGVDTGRFCPSEKDEALLKALNLTNSPVVISVRNFLPVYDIESLIRAIPLILKASPDTRFVIIGSGSEEHSIKTLSTSLSVMQNIRFLGQIPNTDLPNYLNSADIYVSTSLSDAGIASSTAEAMACGLPVVVTDSGENNKWIKDGEGGFLVPVRSPGILAEGIIKLIQDKELRSKAGAVNRKTIVEKNDYYTEMEKMEKLCKGVVIQAG